MNDIEKLISEQLHIAVAEAFETLTTDKEELKELIDAGVYNYWSNSRVNVLVKITNMPVSKDYAPEITTIAKYPGLNITICVDSATYNALVNALKESLNDKEE